MVETKLAKLMIAVPLVAKSASKSEPEKKIMTLMPVNCWKDARPIPTHADVLILGSKNVCL